TKDIFDFGRRNFRMVKLGCDLLCPPGIMWGRVSAADVAGDNARGFAQSLQCPYKIDNGEAAVLPVGHRFVAAKTIEVDGDVDIFAGDSPDKSLKSFPPIRPHNRAATMSILRRSIVGPRMDFEFAGAFRAPIPKNLPRPPAFEITTAPYAHLLHVGQLERTIDPTSCGPSRRRHGPIGMVVERNDRDASRQPTQPKRGQVMKITGAVEHERPKLRRDFAIELFDQTRRRRKSQARPPLARIEPRERPRRIRPRSVKIDM